MLTIEGLETYILQPRDPIDFDLLVEAVRPAPRPGDVDVVIGVRGPIAPPRDVQRADGPHRRLRPDLLLRPRLADQVDPTPGEYRGEASSSPAAEELFGRIMQMADNAGATDEHRALNYLAVRYPAIYATAADAFGRNALADGGRGAPSRLSGVRKIVDVIFAYTNRQTDVTEKFFVRVDVTEEFPFLVTKMSPYYDR